MTSVGMNLGSIAEFGDGTCDCMGFFAVQRSNGVE
jgi:hypothetical protein